MKFSHKNIILYLFVAFVIMTFAVIFIVNSNVFELKSISYDFMIKINSNKQAASNDIVLVVIDDKSLSDLGRWPWKRSLFNEIFEYLNDYTDSKLIAFDALVASENKDDPNDDKKLFQNIGKYDKLTTGVAFSENDFPFLDNKTKRYEKELLIKNDLKIEDKRTNKKQSKYKSFTIFPENYLKNTKSMGAVNVIRDSDGYIRRVQQIIDYKGNLYCKNSD